VFDVKLPLTKHNSNKMITSYTTCCRIHFLGMMLSLSNADYNPDFHPNPTSSTICPAEFNGYLPSSDCKKYYNCWKGEKKFEIECAEGQLYQIDAQHCVDETLVTCQSVIMNSNNDPLQLDIVSDVICSTVGTGQQGLSDCSGFAVCDSGFVMEMVQCEEGSMYDESTESCRVDKTECGPSTAADDDEPTGKFYPNWSSKKCDEKTSSHGLGVYYGYYDSRIACCSHNFISSIDQLESCIGSTLEELFGESEDFPEGTGYVPEWGSGSSSCGVRTVNDDSAAWMKHTMKSKKCECCFEYMSWDLLRCMSEEASR